MAGIGFNQQILPVFLGLLLAAAIAWLYLSRRLYGLLEQGYPGLYETLGRPKPIVMKNMTANYRVLVFLLRRRYESTEDADLIRLGQGMRHILFIYLFCLAGSLLLLLDKAL